MQNPTMFVDDPAALDAAHREFVDAMSDIWGRLRKLQEVEQVQEDKTHLDEARDVIDTL